MAKPIQKLDDAALDAVTGGQIILASGGGHQIPDTANPGTDPWNSAVWPPAGGGDSPAPAGVDTGANGPGMTISPGLTE